MRIGFLALILTLFSQLQAYGLSRVLYCGQREMAPNESSVEIAGVDPLSRDLKLYFSNGAQRAYKVKDVNVSADVTKKALYQGAEMSLLVTREVDRSYNGDVGYLAKLSGRQFPERSMICWFSKQARNN